MQASEQEQLQTDGVERRVHELRQHRQQEHQTFRIGQVDQCATYQQCNATGIATVQVCGQVQAGAAPLRDGQVDQIEDAEPLDDGERQCRAREDGTEADGDQGQLCHQPDL